MSNAREYYSQIKKASREGHALFLANATPEEIAQYDFDNSPEGIAAERKRSQEALTARFAKEEASRAAAKKSKNAARKARKLAKLEA